MPPPLCAHTKQMPMKHGPIAPQSASVAQLSVQVAPPASSGKYWMPIPMPAVPGWLTKVLKAVVTAPHLSPPPATESVIEPD